MFSSEIKSAKYYKDPMTNENVSIDVGVNYDETIHFGVPMNEENTEYQAILEWVAEGNTIEPADEE